MDDRGCEWLRAWPREDGAWPVWLGVACGWLSEGLGMTEGVGVACGWLGAWPVVAEG